MGIIGTPVIDPSLGSAGTLFAVAETYQNGVAKSIEHRLLAIDLNNHSVSSRNVDPPVFPDGGTPGVEPSAAR
jgi:hypothetical protein